MAFVEILKHCLCPLRQRFIDRDVNSFIVWQYPFGVILLLRPFSYSYINKSHKSISALLCLSAFFYFYFTQYSIITTVSSSSPSISPSPTWWPYSKYRLSPTSEFCYIAVSLAELLRGKPNRSQPSILCCWKSKIVLRASKVLVT